MKSRITTYEPQYFDNKKAYQVTTELCDRLYAKQSGFEGGTAGSG